MNRAPARGPQPSLDAVRAARRWAPAPREQRAATRLGGPIAFSAVVHALVIAGAVLWRPPPAPPLPPVYRVDLVAGPRGPRAEGIVAPQPAPQGSPSAAPPRPTAPPTPTPAPAAPAAAPAPPPKAPTPPVARPTPPRAAATAPKEMPLPARPVTPPTRTPPRATPNPTPARPAPATPAPAAPAPGARPAPAGERTGVARATGPVGPRAGGGPEGGRGTDVANVSIRGLEFPYPGYLANIVRQVAVRFEPPNRSVALQADVAFLIHRDGSVTNIRIVKRSGNYAFDLESQGAVEAAGLAKAFGPLPEAFREDVLPVTFSFDPRVIR